MSLRQIVRTVRTVIDVAALFCAVLCIVILLAAAVLGQMVPGNIALYGLMGGILVAVQLSDRISALEPTKTPHYPATSQRVPSRRVLDVTAAIAFAVSLLLIIFGGVLSRVIGAVFFAFLGPWLWDRRIKRAELDAATNAISNGIAILQAEINRRQAARHTPTSAPTPSDQTEDA